MHATTFLSFLLTVSTMETAVSAATYDQSQTGDLNVQVDLKGLHIIALMKGSKEEYVDYDYAYDYSEMTIKPQQGQNGTTSKPAPSTTNSTYNGTSTAASSTEEPSTLATTIMSSTDSGMTTSLKDSLSSSPTTDVASTLTYSETSTVNYSSIESKTTTSLPTVCKKGFVLNQKGECELRQNPTTNALLKLVKLSQKLKLRRERNLADSKNV